MTDSEQIDFAAKLARIARQEGLTALDMAAAVAAVARSGADLTTADDILADRLHAHSSRVGTAPTVDPWLTFLSKFGLTSLDGVDIAKRNRLRQEFQAQQSAVQPVDPRTAFENEMKLRHGDGWQSMMSPTEKVRFAGLFPNPINRFTHPLQRTQLDLEHLREKLKRTTNTWERVQIRSQMSQYEKRLGTKVVD
jgi:hypothetical protein